jgi:hypothetical protein
MRASYHLRIVLRRQLEEYAAGVRWQLDGDDVNRGAEECPLMKTQQTEKI